MINSIPEGKMDVETTWIKQQAHKLGFTLVGITTPDPPARMEVYQAWLEAERHAGMAYLARPEAVHKRADPRRVFDPCQSIIVTGTLHSTSSLNDSTDYQIARYALGDDYHDVLIERMKQLLVAIEQRLGRSLEHRMYTDTGPLLERELAQRAGLGWIGKNTCLIHPQLGSYFLLAELMLDLPLEADQPFDHDRCGTCTRCIEACPTNCILPDRTLDASRCISYLTIENKGPIPGDLREKIGNWLFGCDICQEVCPWNLRFAQSVADPKFARRDVFHQTSLTDLLHLSPGSWQKTLVGSPLTRPRRKGLVRNACVVAGNHAQETRIGDLAVVLENDPEPLARGHAVWALRQIDHPQARKLLEDHILKDEDPYVRQELQGE
jgi:epoxyqueuosine reductase